MWNYNYTSQENKNELVHYGVLGMKWGVRRERKKSGTVYNNYKKATNKLNKLTSKVEKKKQKFEKANRKAINARYKMFATEGSIAAAKAKADAKEYELNKAVNKASKWVNQMEQVFKNTKPSVSKDQIALGKKYKEQLDMYENKLKINKMDALRTSTLNSVKDVSNIMLELNKQQTT